MLRIGCCILFTVFALVVQPVEAGSPAGETAVTGIEQRLTEARDRAAAVDVTELVTRVQETGQTMRLPENVVTEEGSEAARQVMGRFQASSFQEMLQEQQKSIMEKMHIEIPMAMSGKAEEKSSVESFYLFLSSTMTEERVHAYLEDIARAANGVIIPVLHGFPLGLTNKAGKGRFFIRLLQVEPTCRDTPDLCCQRLPVAIRINPALFRRYGITEVPALVYVSGEDSWSAHGDAGLAVLVQRIGQEVSSPALTRLVDTLREAR